MCFKKSLYFFIMKMPSKFNCFYKHTFYYVLSHLHCVFSDVLNITCSISLLLTLSVFSCEVAHFSEIQKYTPHYYMNISHQLNLTNQVLLVAKSKLIPHFFSFAHVNLIYRLHSICFYFSWIIYESVIWVPMVLQQQFSYIK